MIRVKRDGFRFRISDEAFQYLAIQQGAINDFAGERWAWARAYHDSVFAVYESIARFLPDRMSRIIDIGSGLGGIDAILNQHYGGFVEVCPVDGAADEPVMHTHASTFNSEKVTRAFLSANGVMRCSYFSPHALPKSLNTKLIISVASWCFHYPPGTYLSFVKASLAPGGILIVDVRRDKPWRELLSQSFEEIGIAHKGRKADRIVYQA